MKTRRRNLIFTVSNLLTLARIGSVPFIVHAMMTGHPTRAWVLFSCSALTDLFDGALARWLNQESHLGALLDPLADKALFISCFASFAILKTQQNILPAGFLYAVFAREGIIVVGAALIFARMKRLAITPTWIGKTTVALYMVIIGWMLLCDVLGSFPGSLFDWVVYLCMGTGLISLLEYIHIGIARTRE